MLMLSTLLIAALTTPSAPAAHVAPDTTFRSVTVSTHPVSEQERWAQFARNVTITRDDWGIAHVHGVTDADAVFGMVYAQAEDDFNRVETNYINALGRLAETEGESAIWRDLRMKLFIDPDTLKARYAESPAWLKALMDAWADGLNYYLAKHRDVHPRVITHFEPWMALSFSEGSIGGDMERVNLNQLRAFYDTSAIARPSSSDGQALQGDGFPPEPGGSNGIAIAPKNTVDHHALLLINPHTSFFFRSELQMTSDEGLNAYGAVTWGQFFVYQGFNDRTGWMHTSSGVDAIDEYLETVSTSDGRYSYRYGDALKPMVTRTITVPYQTDHGMAERTFTAYYTQHGPVVRKIGDKWVTIRLMNEPLRALTQSYTRTKAMNYAEFVKSMELHTNSSNNTIYADADGNIAYFHGNFIPRRDTSFDWSRPVDGSNPATDWHGLLSLDETPDVLNPASGWLYNSNNWPWSAAGPSSPKREDYPRYVEGGEESARGLHAIRVLENTHDFTIKRLRDAAFDSYQTWFTKPIPALVRAWDNLASTDSLKRKLAPEITLLRNWDLRWGASSIPTSLAVYWGSDIMRRAFRAGRGAGGQATRGTAADPLGGMVTDRQMLESLNAAVDKLTADFGTWRTPWGDINRFQRLDDSIASHFSDDKPSIPVPFTTATWGSLASFAARSHDGSKKIYGTSGNSFVAVVEFGDSIHAIAVTAGGESGDPASPHFNDEAQRYAAGALRTVYFYPAQLKGHTERVYHPGE